MTLLWTGVAEAHYVGDTRALLVSIGAAGWDLPAVRCTRWRPLRGALRFVEVWV